MKLTREESNSVAIMLDSPGWEIVNRWIEAEKLKICDLSDFIKDTKNGDKGA